MPILITAIFVKRKKNRSFRVIGTFLQFHCQTNYEKSSPIRSHLILKIMVVTAET